MQGLFALFMLGTAAYSHKPRFAEVPVEDLLQSITGPGKGFAFTLGVVARFLSWNKNEVLRRAFDVTAILAATLLTPSGETQPSTAGLLQRVMSAFA